MFSFRVPTDLQPNRLARAVRSAREAGRPLIDLTLSNPTRANLSYPQTILRTLASPEALRYDPQPFGLPEARQAVADDYARRGVMIASDRIVLTASTSEAYSLLFKLLCASAGDAVLVPVPSYPLFDHLTQLDGVRAVPYRLEYHGRWVLDVVSVDDAWSGSVQAVLAVTPNNPTGSVLSTEELEQLSARCLARDAALIVDEVFADYPLAAPTSNAGFPVRTLTFRLGGLSKSAGLPQVKLGWIAVDGPEALVREALSRLELICDTYLSVSTPVQIAAPTLITEGAAIRRDILARVKTNYAALVACAASRPSCELLQSEAGWTAVVRVPAMRREEDLAVTLIEEDGVVVYPGFFFDFPHEAFLVVSLLPEPGPFAEGVRRVLARADV